MPARLTRAGKAASRAVRNAMPRTQPRLPGEQQELPFQQVERDAEHATLCWAWSSPSVACLFPGVQIMMCRKIYDVDPGCEH